MLILKAYALLALFLALGALFHIKPKAIKRP